MPIYDASYRRYQARAPLGAWRFWPIARHELRRAALRRMLLLLGIAAWVPFLFFAAAGLVVAHAPGQVPLGGREARVFEVFLGVQAYLAFLLTLFSGSGLIADDLGSGGMLLYLARAVSRRDYVIGKLVCLGLLNLGVTLAPALLLYGLALTLLHVHFLKWELAWIGPAIVAQSLLLALVLSVLALAFSSLTRRAWISGLALVSALIGLDLAQGALSVALGLDAAVLLSPLGALRTVGSALFGSATGDALYWAWALLALALLVAGSLALLRVRVRAVEVVA